MSIAIYNTIDRVVGEHGGGEALARDLKIAVGDEIALNALSGDREEDLPPRRLGHTELEAAMRWCPLAREVTPVGKGKKDVAIGNRYLDRDGSDYANPAGCRCIGSVCMVWRSLDPTRGYCGLADRPPYQPLGEPRRLPDRTPLERPTASEQWDLFDDLYGAASCRGVTRSTT